MDNNQEKIKCRSNKVRNQLVGFATFLLIIAIIAPNIITDKSNSLTSTIPILQSGVIDEQNQDFAVKNESSYTPDSDQYPSPLASPDIIDESFDSQITTSSEKTDKP